MKGGGQKGFNSFLNGVFTSSKPNLNAKNEEN